VRTSTRLRTGLIFGAALTAAATLPVFFGQSKQLSLALVDRDGKKTPLGFCPPTPSHRAFHRTVRASPTTRIVTGRCGLQISPSYRLLAAQRPVKIITRCGRPTEIESCLRGTSKTSRHCTCSADGTGNAERLATGRAPESWSAKNQMFSFITLGNYYNIWTYSLKDKKASPLIDTPGVTEHSSRFSPDGKWIAYTSIETGRFEVFVQPFPLTGAKYQISKQGGGHALWSPDGKELFSR
jgi:hypothetical protein